MAIAQPPQRPPRERIQEAIVDLVVEQGYEEASVEEILQRAAVGQADFDRYFASKEDCCIQTYDALAARYERLVFGAYRRHEVWRDGLRAAAYEAVRFFRDNPRQGRFGVYGLLQASDLAQARRESTLQTYAGMIDEGRGELADPDSLSRSTAETVMGSIMGSFVKEATEGRLDDVEWLVPELMFVAVRPYLGLAAAREELSIPPPPEQGGLGG